MATFPERLKELRKKNQLTQQRLADELGVNRVNITRWEKGNIEPNLAQLGNIAIYFNTSIDYLIGKIDKEYEDTSIQEIKELSDDEREKFFNNALL
ncbi:XRE family transcriptional regulator, partial [Streptococcus pseudopneumoniae]|uniref:helix-turn-helix domain-containing protein n=1 Tax=Streptococcus pseudopneumoniae TaxID=257758 RepID=UPI00110C3ED2